MTSSVQEEVTSELPDVNTSMNFNVTVTAINTQSVAGNVSTAIPMIAVAFLLALAVFGLCGNGFTLITIRMTPRLWTKTNFILASMLVSHFLTGVSMVWSNSYMPHINGTSPCRFNVVMTSFSLLIKITVYVSGLHYILVSLERYIAIVYPLQYETLVTDRTLKCTIYTVWMIGIFIGMTFALWLINADPSKCAVIPAHYHLLDVFVYTLDCTSLFICYGRILAISWRHRRRIGPQPANFNSAQGPSMQSATVATGKQNNKATTSEITVDSNNMSLTDTGASSAPAVTSGAASASELTQKQQRQKIKSRRREYKAVYLTSAIVGTFVILGFPYMCGRVLDSIGYNAAVTGYIKQVGGAMTMFNFASTWAIYAAVSKSYRRAYRQMLIRIGCCCCKNVTLPAEHSLVV